MVVNEEHVQSMSATLAVAMNGWADLHTPGEKLDAATMVATLVRCAAGIVKGTPDNDDKVQFASDAQEAFAELCGVDPTHVMRYRLKHRKGAFKSMPPQARA